MDFNWIAKCHLETLLPSKTTVDRPNASHFVIYLILQQRTCRSSACGEDLPSIARHEVLQESPAGGRHLRPGVVAVLG